MGGDLDGEERGEGLDAGGVGGGAEGDAEGVEDAGLCLGWLVQAIGRRSRLRFETE